MLKSNILNLILLIIVLSLGSFIYFSEEQSTRLELLTAIDSSSIDSISIRHNKNQTEIIRRDDDTWSIQSPVNIDANNFRINSLLELLNTPIHKKYPIAEINLKSVSPQKASTSIKFDDTVIIFGDTNPATSLRYIKLGQFIYTIEDVFYPLLSSNFSTLVSLNLLPNNSTITKLILPNQTISKDNKQFWHSNIATTADDINTIIDDWQHVQAFGVHKYFDRSPDKASNYDEVFIYIKSQEKPIRYLITDTDPWLILARPEIDLEYHLDIKAYQQLISLQ